MAPSRSLSWSRTAERIQSHSHHQSRTMTHAICLTLLLSLSSILNVNAQLYSSEDPLGPLQQTIIRQNSRFIQIDDGATDLQYFDRSNANGYNICTEPGILGGIPCATRVDTVTNPWKQLCSGLVTSQGTQYSPIDCAYQYTRSNEFPSSWSYSEIFVQIPLTSYRSGTIINVRGNVSQQFEAETAETHYVYIDYYRGPYNREGNFPRGYFQPELTNNATTFLYRDVILQEAAASYPNYTFISQNRPLPANVTFALLHYGVSSGSAVGLATPRKHPQSIFDVKVYARKLETGPKVNIFYNGPTPAGPTARVYFSTSQCLRTGNFTNSSMLSQLNIVAPSVPIIGMNLSLVTPGANQLYALDLTFANNVAGIVTITMPANQVFNDFADVPLPATTPPSGPVLSGNSPSNTFILDVLTLTPSLTIYSPNYPTFPVTQQSRDIQFTFNFSTDVYGFDITRVGLCRTNYQNDTCAEYKKVNTSTNFWDFPGYGIVTGTFLLDPVSVLKNYTLSLTNVPDGTYRVRVNKTDALSGASQNLLNDVESQAPIRVDNVRPTVTITPIAANTSTDFGNTYVNQDQLILFTLQFSELIASLNSSHLQVNGGGIVGKITPGTTAPNSKDPSSTWCNSITTASANTTCRSQYTVQVNHTGTNPNRTTITLSYYPSDTVSSQSIVDLAGNPLNSTDTSFPEVFRPGSIIFSNTNPTATIYPLQQDLLTNEFQVQGLDKTHQNWVRYNITFDYPVESFNFATQYSANNTFINASRSGSLVNIPISWGTTTKLDNYTFQSNLTYGPGLSTTLLTIYLKPSSVADVAGNFNLQSNSHQLNLDTKPPVCSLLTYGPGLDRFGPTEHSNLTNYRNLTYIFTFDEPVNPSYVSAFTTTFQNLYSRSFGGIFNFTTANTATAGVITAFYTPASDFTDNGLNVAVRLENVTDLYENTATVASFSTNCLPRSFEFDFDAPNMTFVTNKSPFARMNSSTSVLVSAPLYGAPLTKDSSVVVTIKFYEYVNLTQAALLYQLDKQNTGLVNNNGNITGFVGSDCASGVGVVAGGKIETFCRNFNVTLVGEDTSYSILTLAPSMASLVTDLAGNPVSNNVSEIYLTDQTRPRVELTTTYPKLDNVYRTNLRIVQIDMTFSKHIDTYPGNMTGVCRNGTHNSILASSPLTPIPGQTTRTVFYATFNVSEYDMSICEFTIHPNDVFDLVGNTLANDTSVFISTRFATINAEITSPRGWLTNDLNPIPFCIKTDTEAVLYTPNFGGPTDALNNLTTGASHRLQNSTTVPLVYDAILNVNLPTQNRTYNSTTRMFCANIIPTSSAVTDIRIVILENTLRDIYNNSNQQNFTFQIRRFDLNPETYENLVKDGIIVNSKLANNSVSGRNIQDGTIQQHHMANNSIGTNQLIDGAVQRQDIAQGAVGSNEIAAGVINNTHLANGSVDAVKLADNAVTNTKLANNSITSEKIVDGSILTQDLANNSITFDKLVADAVHAINILNGTITTEKIAHEAIVDYLFANNSVETRDIKERAITTTKIAVEAVTGTELATDAVTSDKILNGSIHHVDMANSSVGTFTIIPNSVTFLNMANNSIDEFNLVDSSVATRSIRDSAITTPKIANESVTNPKVAPNTINTTQIQASGITEINIANNSISNRVIQNAAISTNQIQQAAITNVLVAPSTINTTQIQEAGVTESNVANNSISSRTIIPQAVGTREIGDGSVTNGKLANNSVSYRTIASGSIDSSKIIPGSIMTESLSPQAIATINFQNGTILNEFIAANAINTSQIQPGAVVTINIAEEAVETAQLGYRAVTGEKIAPGQISRSHFTDDVNRYLSLIMAETSTLRPLDGSYIHNASLYGYKLANGTVGTQQIGDAAVTEVKIAENAVTWRQIAPKTINSDNLGDSSVLGIAIAHSQIQPHHLIPDFFTNSTLTSLATALTGEQKGLSTKNFATGSINAATVITPGTVTNDLLGDKEVSLRKLSDSTFTMFTNMYNRLAQLEAQMTTLLNNIDSRCIFNTTFTVANVPPVAVNTTSIHTPMHTSSIEHYMSVHPDLIAEAQRRATEANTPRAFHTEQVNTVQYPKTIVEGAKYCGDGAGVPANNGTATDKSGSILNSAANMNPSTLVMAILALLFAAVQL